MLLCVLDQTLQGSQTIGGFKCVNLGTEWSYVGYQLGLTAAGRGIVVAGSRWRLAR